MGKMAGRILRRGDYCWCCHDHGPIGRVNEKRLWRHEAAEETVNYDEELTEAVINDTFAYRDCGPHRPGNSLDLHEVAPGVMTNWNERCACGCGCFDTFSCHCVIMWDNSTLYPSPVICSDHDEESGTIG